MPGFDFGDVLVGDDGHNMVQGLGGVDCMDGRGGRDVISYEADAAYGGTSAVIVDLANGMRSMALAWATSWSTSKT